MKRILTSTKFWLLMTCGILLLVLLAWQVVWRSPPYYTNYQPRDFRVPIMTMDQYSALVDKHPRPYIVNAENSKGALLLYGAAHTKDPQSPEIADIAQRWESFKPTVALCEGRLGFLISGLMDPVRNYGEAGALNALARKSGVPLYTWEPPREVEIALMLKQFPAERVALFYVLRPYFSDIRHGKPGDPDKVVEDYRRKRTQYAGLENTLKSVEDIDRIWRRDFAGQPDWRDTSDEYGLPGYLSELSARSNEIRDEHLANVIVNLIEKGERVFVVTGSSHSVKLDKTLRDALGQAS